jgi:hypothetical protein
MSEDIDDKFYEPLADDHLVMINKDTFTVERLKELVDKKLKTKLETPFINNLTIATQLRPLLSIIEGELHISLDEMKWTFPETGIESQLLRIGSQSWITGKLRIQASIKLIGRSGSTYTEIKSYVEFCPNDILGFHKTCEEKNKE